MSPNLQAHVEQAIQTLKHECLDHFVIVDPSQLNRVTSQFQAWYNFERDHTACDDLPQGCEELPEIIGKIEPCDVACTTRLSLLLKHYWRRAA